MKKFKVKHVRIIKEFTIMDIEAETPEQAIQIVQDGEHQNFEPYEFLDTIHEDINIIP